MCNTGSEPSQTIESIGLIYWPFWLSGIERRLSRGRGGGGGGVGCLLGCLTSQQHVNVSQGRICSDDFTCCRTEIQVADQAFHLTQSPYTDTGPTSPSTDPITPGVWQGSTGVPIFEVTCMTRPREIPAQAGFEPLLIRSKGGRLHL